MEKMAEDVVTCLNKGSFGEKPIMCFRGIADQMLFDDEDVLETYAALSDYRKKTYDITYAPVNNDIMNYLEKVWGTKKGFVGTWKLLVRLWNLAEVFLLRLNSTTVYRDDENWLGTILPRYERQPIPDYHKWIISGKYHYLSYEERRDLPHGPWDNCPELFLTERIINACFRAFPNPTSDMISAVSFLAWVSEKDFERSYSEKHQSLLKTKIDDIEKEKWSKHSLYKFTKAELILKCVQKKFEPTGNKVDLVKRLSKIYPFEELESNPKLYNGDLKSVPGTISGLNQLNVARLREILRHHGILEDGVKEKLVLRVGLLKEGAAWFSKGMLLQRTDFDYSSNIIWWRTFQCCGGVIYWKGLSCARIFQVRCISLPYKRHTSIVRVSKTNRITFSKQWINKERLQVNPSPFETSSKLTKRQLD